MSSPMMTMQGCLRGRILNHLPAYWPYRKDRRSYNTEAADPTKTRPLASRERQRDDRSLENETAEQEIDSGKRFLNDFFFDLNRLSRIHEDMLSTWCAYGARAPRWGLT